MRQLSKERLLQLREALLFGDPIDESARLDLLVALEVIGAQRPRGRPADERLRTCAAVAGVLHEKHGVPLKSAFYAAWPDSPPTQRASLERIYRELASMEVVKVKERLVDAALAVLGRNK